MPMAGRAWLGWLATAAMLLSVLAMAAGVFLGTK